MNTLTFYETNNSLYHGLQSAKRKNATFRLNVRKKNYIQDAKEEEKLNKITVFVQTFSPE